jgi:hypothetical protein
VLYQLSYASPKVVVPFSKLSNQQAQQATQLGEVRVFSTGIRQPMTQA